MHDAAGHILHKMASAFFVIPKKNKRELRKGLKKHK